MISYRLHLGYSVFHIPKLELSVNTTSTKTYSTNTTSTSILRFYLLIQPAQWIVNGLRQEVLNAKGVRPDVQATFFDLGRYGYLGRCRQVRTMTLAALV